MNRLSSSRGQSFPFPQRRSERGVTVQIVVTQELSTEISDTGRKERKARQRRDQSAAEVAVSTKVNRWPNQSTLS